MKNENETQVKLLSSCKEICTNYKIAHEHINPLRKISFKQKILYKERR